MTQRFNIPALSFKTLRQIISRCPWLLLLAVEIVAAQGNQKVVSLESDKPIERVLAGGRSYLGHLALSPAHYKVKVVELRPVTAQDLIRMQAEALLSEADRLKQQGEAEALRKAVEKYRAAISLWQTLSDRKKEARTLLRLGQAQNALGDSADAIESFNRAVPLFRAEHDLAGEADTLNDSGIAYDRTGDKKKAVELLNQALPLFRQVGDKRGEGAALNNLGGIYWETGDLDKALDFYNQALPLTRLTRSTEDLQAEASVLGNIGEAYRSMGEYQQAFDYYQQSLGPTRAVKDYEGEAYIMDNMGSLYSSLGDFQKALPYLLQGLEIRRRIGDQVGEEISLNNLGSLYRRKLDFAKAIEYYDQGLALARKLRSPDGEVAKLVNLGAIYVELNEPLKAIDYLQPALAIAKHTESRPFEAKSLDGLGQAYAAVGETQKAFDYYNQALPLSRAVKDRKLEALIQYHLAQSLGSRGDLTGALSHVEEALALVESVRMKIGSQELRSAYFATVQGYYEFYINLLMRLHKQHPSAGYDSKALQASERQRARSLLETLAEANANIRQGVDPKLVERERSLQQQLNTTAQRQTRLLGGAHTEAQAQAISQEIEALTTGFQQVEAEIRRTSPRYAALTQPQPLMLKEIQTQVLDQDTLLLEYSLGTDRSYLWAVTPTSIASYELPKRDRIETAARRVYDILTARGQRIEGERQAQRRVRIAQSTAQYAEAAARLSRMVLAPVAMQLGNKRLLVVSDGALQYIPFAALPDPANTISLTPLVIKHEIISLPSASTISVLRREIKDRKPAARTVAVLADPVFEETDERVKSIESGAGANRQRQRTRRRRDLPLGMERSLEESGLRSAGFEIPRLPGTRQEAGQILALVPQSESKQAFDFAASRATATASDLAQYRFIHFATHGFLNSLHPELSGIVLSMVDEKGTAQDGFLRANDIFNLKLPAELVVLSACQTGLGKEIKGEGLVGLTRGFMYAGAPRVVVSLWSVSDAATAELMTRFYRGMLKGGLRPAAALRAAQVSLINEKRWAQPFYWAAFTLQGEWR
ncbi:MAG TPA: CHAT domain-containing tetratricopeptide repeat protein [Pyrinomonadaceae bacterium]|jgi:CHAT domain-containing protein